MQTLVLILMIVVCFNFMLKHTFHGMVFVAVVAVISALFVGFLWPVAIEQSKMQIAAWLSNPALMLDTSVILTIDVALQMWFCIASADRMTGVAAKKSQKLCYGVLSVFPGILFFGVIFSLLVAVIFSFPGTTFALLGWGFAATVAVCIPLGVWLLKKLLPEESIRLELLFMSNALVAILGVVATVNGRTAAQGTGEVNWPAFAATGVLLLLGLAAGMALREISLKRKHNNNT